MNLQLINVTCASCSGIFQVPALLSGAYGEFLLRSAGSFEVAYLNALEDATYDEVYELIKQNPRMHGKGENLIADVLRHIYGVIACDPDSAGHCFGIGLVPPCPFCQGTRVAHWEATEPPVFVDLPVNPVTHIYWDSLSKAQKIDKIEGKLASLGYPPHVHP